MKKFFVALSCCLLMATSATAQDVQSVVEAPDSEVVLASAQDPVPAPAPVATTTAAPVAPAPVAPAVQDAAAPAPAPVAAPAAEMQSSSMDVAAPMTVEGTSVMSSGCGCGSTVQSYAPMMTSSAPMMTSSAPVATGCGCAAPAPVATGCGCAAPAPAASCCPAPRRSVQRPYIVNRMMMGRRCCN